MGVQAGLLDWHELDPAQPASTSDETVRQTLFFLIFQGCQHPSLLTPVCLRVPDLVHERGCITACCLFQMAHDREAFALGPPTPWIIEGACRVVPQFGPVFCCARGNHHVAMSHHRTIRALPPRGVNSACPAYITFSAYPPASRRSACISEHTLQGVACLRGCPGCGPAAHVVC